MILLYTTKSSKGRRDILEFCETHNLEVEERRLGLNDEQYVPTVEDVQNIMLGIGSGYGPKADPYNDEVSQLLHDKKVEEYGELVESMRIIELAWWMAENPKLLRDYFIYDTSRGITCTQFGVDVQGMLVPRHTKRASIEQAVLDANLLRELDVLDGVSPILG